MPSFSSFAEVSQGRWPLVLINSSTLDVSRGIGFNFYENIATTPRDAAKGVGTNFISCSYMDTDNSQFLALGSMGLGEM